MNKNVRLARQELLGVFFGIVLVIAAVWLVLLLPL
jgi:hypothetical protein